MRVITKKYELPKNTYIKTALGNLIKEQWWYGLFPVAFGCLAFIWPSWWWPIISLVVIGGYIGFWALQFTAATQMDQFKMIFDKYIYEIDSRQILMKLNQKQGMPVDWAQIKSAKAEKTYFILFLSKAQFFYWPYSIFNSENDQKFVEMLLKRKELLK